MLGPLKKAVRYLQREYPVTTSATGYSIIIGAGIGTAVTFGLGAPLFAIPLTAAGLTGFSNLVTLGDEGRVSENSVALNGFKLVGDKRDLSSLVQSQKLIDRVTKKMKHLAELPEKTRKQLLAHVEDVQAALSRVRVYRGYGGEQLGEFSFQRNYFDTRGNETQQVIATVKFEPAAESKPVTLEVIDSRPQKPAVKVPANDATTSAEFGQLAKKVDAVAKRVDTLENPVPVVLDKPKLKTGVGLKGPL